jgi:3-hydroxybutyryl-CoA dehydrogenase
MTIERAGVVGGGQMGAGIAELCARAGVDVRVVVSRPTSLEKARERVLGSLDRAVAKGRLDASGRDAAAGRITFTADLVDLADAQFVVEAVPEDEALKRDIFEALDKAVTDPAAILASTTSSIPVTRLARATGRPEWVVGTHFFNPAMVLPLVEVTAAVLTAPETVVRTEDFLTGTLGKQVIRAPDRSGLVVNALLCPYLMAAIRMLESGFASAENIDRGMTQGCAHPMGPLALSDMIGLDVIEAVGRAMFEEYRETHYAPPPLLSRMVEAGLLGRKTGRGFYSYA